MNSKVALLRKIKSFLPLSTRKRFCNTHILPHMDYCSIIFGSSSHIAYSWPKRGQHASYSIMVFKSINNLAPTYMSDMFKKISETHCRVTRASNDKHKVLYTDSFAYSGAIIWNNLSPSIRNCSNLNKFKSAYLNDYFS